MQVLWVCNILMPKMAQKLHESVNTGGGWMVSLAEDISKNNAIELSIAAPYSGTTIQRVLIDGVSHIAIPLSNMAESWKSVINELKPDVIHLHGTEFSYGKTLMDVCPNENYVVSIQGLVSVYAEHYCAYLPRNVIKKKSFRDILKHAGILNEQKKFAEKGKYEQAILQKTKHIIGRTSWDKACTRQINPAAAYHHCNESLRNAFYQASWDFKECEKHSILCSQGNYPIKGLHLVLQALPQIIKDYPDMHLYIAGNNIVVPATLKQKLKETAYGKYLNHLISELQLNKYITFTGSLREQEMCDRMRKSHVFLSASSIENSPNSLGEAMLLGVPCVSSDVGGVTDMMVHQKEGFVYPADEYYMISYYVSELFSNETLALQFSENAKAHATITHNRGNNLNQILKIYKEICD